MTNSYRLQTKDRMFVFNRPHLFHYIPHPKSHLKLTITATCLRRVSDPLVSPSDDSQNYLKYLLCLQRRRREATKEFLPFSTLNSQLKEKTPSPLRGTPSINRGRGGTAPLVSPSGNSQRSAVSNMKSSKETYHPKAQRSEAKRNRIQQKNILLRCEARSP